MNHPLDPILNVVAETYAIKPSERLLSKGRDLSLTTPRHIAYWATQEVTGAYLAQTADLFKRNPKTVVYGLRRTQELWETDTEMRKQLQDILERCRAAVKENPIPPLKKVRVKTRRNLAKPKPEKVYLEKPRKCLMCHNEFMSSHIGERVCKGCKEKRVWRSGGIVA